MSEKNRYLGEFEEMVLLTVIRLGMNAYGVTIHQTIEEIAGWKTSLGAIYTTLKRLEQKGFVSSRQEDLTAQHRGRAKRYFQIEGFGLQALHDKERMRTSLRSGWIPVPDLQISEGQTMIEVRAQTVPQNANTILAYSGTHIDQEHALIQPLEQSKQTDSSSTPPRSTRREKDTVSIRHIVHTHSKGVVEDVVPVLRIIISNLTTHAAFIISGIIAIWLVEWSSHDLITKNMVAFFIMEGLRVFAFVGTAISYCRSVYSDYQTQREASRLTERKAGLKND